jgi:hypothetical protein
LIANFAKRSSTIATAAALELARSSPQTWNEETANNFDLLLCSALLVLNRGSDEGAGLNAEEDLAAKCGAISTLSTLLNDPAIVTGAVESGSLNIASFATIFAVLLRRSTVALPTALLAPERSSSPASPRLEERGGAGGQEEEEDEVLRASRSALLHSRTFMRMRIDLVTRLLQLPSISDDGGESASSFIAQLLRGHFESPTSVGSVSVCFCFCQHGGKLFVVL